jgi:predicted ATPase
MTDVARFDELFQHAERSDKDERVIELLREALLMARADFLPGFYDEWVVAEQNRVRDQSATAAYRLAALLEADGQHEEAMQWIRETVRTNPTHNEAVIQLFEYLVSTGQAAEAVACYSELQERLQTKWNMEAPVEVQRLMIPVLSTYTTARRRGRPPGKNRHAPTIVMEETETDVAVSPMAQLKKANVIVGDAKVDIREDARGYDAWLPLPITKFFGRESEINRLRWILENPTNRVITLTGPGGSGKTRLALNLAERMRDPVGELSAEMRVLFVSLAETRDGSGLPETLAHALNITQPIVPSDPMRVIADFLAVEPTLLILDNFEQLVNTGAERWVVNLLQRVTSLSCLITSRVRVSIQGEQEFPILPLPVPDESMSQADAETLLRECPAVALFVDRAQLAIPFFQINRKNADAIVQLVRQLEGIPLAIELAAARSRVTTPVQMVEQMRARFDLLVSNRPIFEGRHRSLRDTIAWSLELLTEEQQHYFLQLCVLRGSWFAEDAEKITCDLLTDDHLVTLADASLLQTEWNEECIRYHMLETLREFAEERLTERIGPEGIRQLRDRHVARFLAVSEEVRGIPVGSQQVSWMTKIQNCQENCCAALEWCLKTPGIVALEASIRIGTSLNRYWRLNGWYQRGGNYFRAIREREDFNALNLKTKSALLNCLGILDMGAGKLDSAYELFELGRQMRQELGDEQGANAALINLAILSAKRGDYCTAYRAYAEGLDYWRSMNDLSMESLSLLNMGCATASLGNFGKAQEHYTKSKEIAQKIGHTLYVAQTLCCQGFTQLELAEVASARQCFEESLRHLSSLQLWSEAATAMLGLGRVAEESGEYQQAQERFSIALDYFAASGISPNDQLPFDNSPYWTQKLSQSDRQERNALSRVEQRLRQAISWTLDEMPLLD